MYQRENFIVNNVQGFFINNKLYPKKYAYQSLILKIEPFSSNLHLNILDCLKNIELRTNGYTIDCMEYNNIAEGVHLMKFLKNTMKKSKKKNILK